MKTSSAEKLKEIKLKTTDGTWPHNTIDSVYEDFKVLFNIIKEQDAIIQELKCFNHGHGNPR